MNILDDAYHIKLDHLYVYITSWTKALTLPACIIT